LDFFFNFWGKLDFGVNWIFLNFGGEIAQFFIEFLIFWGFFGFFGFFLDFLIVFFNFWGNFF